MIAMAGMGAVADGHLYARMGSRGGERTHPRRRESRDNDEGRNENA
jgi:hypothetical protein